MLHAEERSPKRNCRRVGGERRESITKPRPVRIFANELIKSPRGPTRSNPRASALVNVDKNLRVRGNKEKTAATNSTSAIFAFRLKIRKNVTTSATIAKVVRRGLGGKRRSRDQARQRTKTAGPELDIEFAAKSREYEAKAGQGHKKR